MPAGNHEPDYTHHMRKGCCIGLVGGLGVAAAVHYYRALVDAHDRQNATLDLVMAHGEVSRVLEYLRASDREGLATYLLGLLDRLEAAGAQCGVIPAVTPHFCIRELMPRTRLPLFNIFDPLVMELEARSLRRVSVFGTRFVMSSNLYGMIPGVEIVPAHPAEAEYIDQNYTALALSGRATEEQHQGMTAIAQRLCSRDGVEAILFAGTDLTLLFNEQNTDFPYVDCAAIHLRAIINGVLGSS